MAFALAIAGVAAFFVAAGALGALFGLGFLRFERSGLAGVHAQARASIEAGIQPSLASPPTSAAEWNRRLRSVDVSRWRRVAQALVLSDEVADVERYFENISLLQKTPIDGPGGEARRGEVPMYHAMNALSRRISAYLEDEAFPAVRPDLFRDD